MAANLLLMGAESSGFAFSAIVTFIIVAILLTIVHLYFRSKESYKLAIEIPGPDPIPILGNALMALGKSSHGKFIDRYGVKV